MATIKYKAGTYDMQQVLQLQTAHLSVESDVIKARTLDRQPRQSLCALPGAEASKPHRL
jgi:hypothetical protein